ncbi:MAG: hypothetical protein M1607_03625 [Patescibacteria group bacterium]|nr:hypothetical protein [Patescibacteria group bacterium]
MTENIDIRQRADFHVHLGKRTEEDVLAEAVRNHVSVIALLDRGEVRINRLQRAQELGRETGVTVIPAIESFTAFPYQDQEILMEFIGLDFDLDHSIIKRTFDPFSEVQMANLSRKVAFQKNYIESVGFSVNHTDSNNRSWLEISSGRVAETAIEICKIAAGDPANEDLLSSLQGQFRHHFLIRPQDAPTNPEDPSQTQLSVAKALYWQHFAPGRPGFKRWYLPFEEIRDTIHQGQGVIVIAHPKFEHKPGEVRIQDILPEILEAGVDGVEGWDAGKLDRHLARIALSQNKLVLGGSGKDASRYKNREIGLGDNSDPENPAPMFIPPRLLNKIREYKASHSVPSSR